MLEHFARLLNTVPFSKASPGVTRLTIRAIDSAEAPIEEHDLRSAPATADGAITLSRMHEHFDCSYEVEARWDLWSQQDGATKLSPCPIEIICNGEEFDSGAYQDAGHLQIDFGSEDLFLAGESSASAGKLRENVVALQNWMAQVKQVVPLDRYSLWSEEDENFEARLHALV